MSTLFIFNPAPKSKTAEHGPLVSHKESTSVYINGVSGLDGSVKEAICQNIGDHPILYKLLEASESGNWDFFLTVKTGNLFNELVTLNNRLAGPGKIHYQIREAMRNLCSTDSPFVVLNIS